MRVFIVEPLLRNEGGHQYSHALALERELAKRNIPVTVIGNKDAGKKCGELGDFHPCLPDIISEMFSMKPSLANLQRVYRQIKLLRDRLDCLFFDQREFLEQGSVFFLHSLFIFELIAFISFQNRI